MDIKDKVIQEYLSSGCGYRKLQKKYGISRTTICNWVQVYQGIHNLPPTQKQESYSNSSMNSSPKKSTGQDQTNEELLQKIAALEKQLEDQQLKVVVLDTLITVAE